MGKFLCKYRTKDSAAYYFKKNIGHNNVYSDIGAYRNLYEIEKERGNYEEGLAYLEKYTECSDSIYDISNTESLRKIKALYDYQHIEKEKEYLRKKNAEQRAWIIFIVIAIVLGVIILIRYNRNRKAMIREQEKNFMRLTNNNIGKANYI